MMANKQQFCAITGWTAREFDAYLAEGLPAKKKSSSRGDVWQVDTVQAIGWIVNKAVVAVVGDPAPDGEPGALDVNEQRARLLSAQATLAELETEQRRGNLVDRAKVEAALAVIDLALKDRLLTVPMAAAPEVLDAARDGGAPAVADVLAKHINRALRDFASMEVVGRAAGKAA